jgi:endonuclease/exonuclease/phosphatase (EEP) superfamily protein YafD
MAIAAACVALVLVLKAAGRIVWLIDLVTFFWPFVVVGAALVFVISLLLDGMWLKLIGLAGFLAVLYPLLALPPAPASTAGIRLRVLTANLYIDNRNPQEFLALLNRTQPDIVVTQETRPRFARAIRNSGLLPFESSGDLLAMDDKMVFSRYPIRSQTAIEEAVGSAGRPRHPMRLVIDLPTGPVVLYAVHPDTPRDRDRWQRRNHYLDVLAKSIVAEPEGTSIIVAGDWNTPAHSAFFTRFFDQTGLRFARPGWYLPATRFTLRLRPYAYVGSAIDHVAVSSNLGITDWQRGADFGSNHLPIIVDIALPGTEAVAAR